MVVHVSTDPLESPPRLPCRLRGEAAFDAFYDSLNLVDCVKLFDSARPQNAFLRYQVQFCLGLKVSPALALKRYPKSTMTA